MCPNKLNSIKKELISWGYPHRLVNKMKPARLLKCHRKEKEFQEYQAIKEKEYYFSQILKTVCRSEKLVTS